MKLRLVLAFGALIGMAGLSACEFRGGASAVTCNVNSEIEPAERQAADAAARRVITILRAGDGQALYDAMSKEAQAVSNPGDLTRTLATVRSPDSSPATVTRTYQLTGVSAAPTMVACLEPGGTALAQYSGGKQAHVLATAPAGLGREQAFTIWQTFSGGTWKVQGFWINLSKFADRDGQAYWDKAKAERAKAHDFNAVLLYAAADAALNRGPNFQLPIRQAFDADRRSLKAPPMVAGQPPFQWTLDGKPFAIARVESYATDHDLGLMLYQTDAGPLTKEAAEARNRLLIDAFRKDHPEWAVGFDFLGASSPTGPERAFRTVFTKDKGYI